VLYEIHRYPADMIDVVRVPGGDRVVVRPVLPQDAELTAAFFRGLSGSSRYDRFLSPLREPPPELVARFTKVDYADHLALVAEVFTDGRETVIGEARYVRRTDRDSAEFAVSIAEPWQGKGLASLMLSKLASRAAASGVTRMVGETLATNRRMIALACKAGFATRLSPDVSGLILLEKQVLPPSPGRSCGDVEVELAA
jgi:RimJ/RimL family protein N-acetyltransferase